MGSMFRVPSDAQNPTFDDTFAVGKLEWFKSSKADREEWQRRRNLAAAKAAENQNTRVDEWGKRKIAEAEARKQAAREAREARKAR